MTESSEITKTDLLEEGEKGSIEPKVSEGTDPNGNDSIEIDLASGARSFALKNFSESAECFSRACEKLSKKFGESHPELVDAQISYGKALLNNAISLSNVLGQENQILKEENGNERDRAGGSSEKPDSNGKGKEAAEGSKVQSSSSSSGTSKQKNPTNNPRIYFSGDSSDEDETGEEARSKDKAGADDEDDGGDNDEDDEDENGVYEACSAEEELENAFQVLEIARLTLINQLKKLSDTENRASDDDQIKRLNVKLCTVYDLLAEVHQESEQFELAVESYRDSLKVKESATTGSFSARSLAENHLMIALALEMVPGDPTSLTASIENVERATELMRGCLENLKQKKDEPVKESVGDQNPDGHGETHRSATGIDEEIEEIESLIKELEEKKEDLRTAPRPGSPTEKEAALQEYFASASDPSGLIDRGVINDLSKLVKKRVRSVGESGSKALNLASGSGGMADNDIDAKKQKIDQ
ncbi:hypothetical protein PPACK8108_LOCUS14694 [Phakopsora pachyrhizi]|uniref:Tetratricopeptide SHNi-TPR domain-containing protein n=1 Tax=Phakopsora pachyrhizi TaxID=170000 RepID=A0AAV0B6M4_PHAPC|nr:hypothetical protein PPACK8108_LOCUS14694 [Phakopsora pachyrhizi]